MSSSGYTPDIGGGPQPSNLITASTAGAKSAANPARKSITIQNQGTNVLFVKLGDSASTSSFHYTVKASGAQDNGTGGTIKVDDYTGVITIAGTSPRYSFAEFV